MLLEQMFPIYIIPYYSCVSIQLRKIFHWDICDRRTNRTFNALAEHYYACCSVSYSKKASSREGWQFRTDFRDLHGRLFLYIALKALRRCSKTYEPKLLCPCRHFIVKNHRKASLQKTLRYFFMILSPLQTCTVESFTLVNMYYFHPWHLDKFSIPIMKESFTVSIISNGSPSRILMVLLISFGMTTRPRSSIRRTIPVAFIAFLLFIMG